VAVIAVVTGETKVKEEECLMLLGRKEEIKE
jgi:hypothetical protein